jgi:RNA polymerase sigma factor (sigma-70 family)
MASAPRGEVKRYLSRLFGAGSAVGLSDRELLARFAHAVDESAEAAFEAILARHGALVLTVCHQMLGDVHAVEDAFQATFLVLVRRAGSLRVRERGSVGPWLYGVAYRIALKARQGAARQRAREQRVATPAIGAPPKKIEQLEVRAVLHEELNRLPAKYRAPVVLCYFEGRPRDEAAAALGWPVGTVRGRLARARDRLRARLERRGIGPEDGIGAFLLGASVRIEPRARLLETTVAAAVKQLPVAAVGAIANLTLIRLFVARLPAAASALAIALTMAGFGLALSTAPALQPATGPDPVRPAVAAAPPEGRPRDQFGDPLPEQARARLGSTRFHNGESLRQALHTADGKSLVALDNDGIVRVWDAATGLMVRAIDARPARFRQIALSPDGAILATIEENVLLRTWELASGRERRSWHAIGGVCWRLSFSPDGQTVAAAVSLYDQAGKTEEKFISLWDIAAPTERRRRLVGDWLQLNDMVFAPDGKTLITATNDTESRIIGARPEKGSTRLWDLAAGRERARFPVERSQVLSVAISPDGNLVAAGVSDRTVRLYDLGTGREDALRLARDAGPQLEMQKVLVPGPLPASPISHGVMRCLAFSPDGSILAGGSYGTGTGSTLLADVYLWDVFERSELRRIPAHQGGVGSLSFARDGRTLASTGMEPTIRLWEIGSGREAFPQPGHRTWIRNLVVSPADSTVFTGGQDGTIRHWDPASGRELGVIGQFASPIHTLAIAHDGKTLLVKGAVGAPVLCSSETGTEIRRSAEAWGTPSGKVVTIPQNQNGRTTTSFPMFYRTDSKEIIAVSGQAVTISDAGSGKELRRAVQVTDRYRSPALSPDGRILAVVRSRPGERINPAVQLWELASGQPVATVEGPEASARSLAFSPDGRYLAWGSVGTAANKDTKVLVWDIAAGRELRRFEGHQASVNAVGFLPDGRSLVSVSEDSTALVWDLSDLVKQPRAGQPSTIEELSARWKELAGSDAAAAYRAGSALSVPSAVAFLRERLRPAAAPDPQGIPAANGPIGPPEVLQTLRAIAALESVGTPEARAVLETLARGNPGAIATRDATYALERLSHSPQADSRSPSR